MNLRLKKGIIMAGALLCVGGMAFTSQAARTTYVISGDYADAGVWGSGNINDSFFSYGGGLVGQSRNAASGTMDVRRTDGTKTHLDNKKLNRYNLTVPTTTKMAFKGDRNGIKITVKLAGDSKKTGIMKY